MAKPLHIAYHCMVQGCGFDLPPVEPAALLRGRGGIGAAFAPLKRLRYRAFPPGMRRLIECVPNFSEGRDHQRIEALAVAMSGIKGAWVLDVHSDSDHNRSVVTLAGEPERVAEAALRGVAKAVELIDLRRHRGEHPRIGAIDVLPFVPMEGVSISTKRRPRGPNARD
jgi:hypothetical protein